MENLKNHSEKENESRKQQEKEQNAGFSMDDARRGASDMMKNNKIAMPSYGSSMPNFNSGSFNPGSFKMPSMPSLPRL
jgi:hypothetical protein